MMPTDDEMSIREIARTIADFRQEFRSQIGQLLRADVYRAEQGLIEQRIASLEKDRDREEQERGVMRKSEESERQANRRQFLGVTVTAIIAIIVSVIGAFVK